MRNFTIVALALFAVAVLPDLLYACPVCFDVDDDSRIAFLATTGFLTVLPLGFVAGTAMWLRKRSQRLDDQENDEQNDGF